MQAYGAAEIVPTSSNLRISVERRAGAACSGQVGSIRSLAHVEEAGVVRRQQPLVQARAVVIHLEVAQLEREVRNRVRAVDDGEDAALAREPREPLHREQLPAEVRDVTEVHHLGLRRDRLLEPLIQVVLGRRDREVDARHLDLLAPHALIPGGEHAAVVLLGGEHLVAGLEVDAVLRDLQRLARVARDGNLLGVAAELGGEPAARGFAVLFELPAEVDGRLVRKVEIAFERLVHDARARAAVAVIEVDERAIQRERLLNLAPVELILCHVIRRSAGDLRGCGEDLLDAVGLEGEGGGAGGASDPKKRSSADHRILRREGYTRPTRPTRPCAIIHSA